MIAYKTKRIRLVYLSDQNKQGEKHFVPTNSFEKYIKLRKVTPKLCIICDTIRECYMRIENE